MRILSSIACTMALLPLLETTVQANATEANQEEHILVRKAELLQQQQWKSQAKYLNTLIAQQEEPISDNSWSDSSSDNYQEVQNTLLELQGISQYNFVPNRGSPSLTIANPSGFGSDRGFFTGLGYQPNTRYGAGDDENADDGILGFGLGFGSARKAVGVEIGYTMASFGGSRDFGSGGFNAKIHRRFPGNWAVAAGWNGFLTIGGDTDFDDSLYLTTTKIFATRKSLNSAFSRMAVTIGVGNGQFRTEEAIENDDGGINVFSSLAFRIARPLSGVVEWTGQDLGVAASVSPFRRIPITFTAGLRDLAGAGDEPRFIFGLGAGF